MFSYSHAAPAFGRRCRTTAAASGPGLFLSTYLAATAFLLSLFA